MIQTTEKFPIGFDDRFFLDFDIPENSLFFDELFGEMICFNRSLSNIIKICAIDQMIFLDALILLTLTRKC
jgi:hypothetical protein